MRFRSVESITPIADYAAPQSRVDAVVALLQSGRFPLLE
jgi:hypothetical protein